MMAKITSLSIITVLITLFAAQAIAAPEEDSPVSSSQTNAEATLSENQTEDSSLGKEKTFTRQQSLIASLTIFVLAVFVGFEIITKIPPTLHTPLMSGSNAISGITVVGALLAAGFGQSTTMVAFLGMLAVALATINVVGGFLVTHRMLKMFQRKR